MPYHLLIKRVVATTPDPTKISGVTYMFTVNQTEFSRNQVISIDKNGNNFEMVYIHDTEKEGYTLYGGLIFVDENQIISFIGDIDVVRNRYVGKFDLAGNPKHVFLQA